MSKDPFNLADLVIRNAYSYCGAIVHPDETDDQDDDVMAIEIDDIMAAIPSGLVVEAFRQALALAIPAVIRDEFTQGRCDTCDTPYLRCVEKAFDAPPGTLCCGECSHMDTPVGSQQVYSSAEMTALLTAAATGAPTLEEAAGHLERQTVAPAAEAPPVSTEVLSVAVRIGLTDAHRTLDELRSAHARRSGRPDLAESITAWEDAVARLEAFAGPSPAPVGSRRSTDG